ASAYGSPGPSSSWLLQAASSAVAETTRPTVSDVAVFERLCIESSERSYGSRPASDVSGVSAGGTYWGGRHLTVTPPREDSTHPLARLLLSKGAEVGRDRTPATRPLVTGGRSRSGDHDERDAGNRERR